MKWKRFTRICKICGVIIKNVGSQTKYCKICGKTEKKRKINEYNHKNYEKQKELRMIQKEEDKKPLCKKELNEAFKELAFHYLRLIEKRKRDDELLVYKKVNGINKNLIE